MRRILSLFVFCLSVELAFSAEPAISIKDSPLAELAKLKDANEFLLNPTVHISEKEIRDAFDVSLEAIRLARQANAAAWSKVIGDVGQKLAKCLKGDGKSSAQLVWLKNLKKKFGEAYVKDKASDISNYIVFKQLDYADACLANSYALAIYYEEKLFSFEETYANKLRELLLAKGEAFTKDHATLLHPVKVQCLFSTDDFCHDLQIRVWSKDFRDKNSCFKGSS